jgi:predicted phosphodiesterase
VGRARGFLLGVSAAAHKPSDGRPRRLKRLFPNADLVVFGHSHLPFYGEGEDGQLLLNPGSPTQRRRAPTHTFAGKTARYDMYLV